MRFRRKISPAIAVPIAYGGVRGPDGRSQPWPISALHAGLRLPNMVVTDPAQRGQRASQAVESQGSPGRPAGCYVRPACRPWKPNTPVRARSGADGLFPVPLRLPSLPGAGDRPMSITIRRAVTRTSDALVLLTGRQF